VEEESLKKVREKVLGTPKKSKDSRVFLARRDDARNDQFQWNLKRTTREKKGTGITRLRKNKPRVKQS